MVVSVRCSASRILLAFVQVGLIKFLQLEQQKILFGAGACFLFLGLCQRSSQGLPCLMIDPIGRHALLVSSSLIDQPKLELRIVEQLRLMLAMHMHQAFAQLAQLLQAHRRVVDEGA